MSAATSTVVIGAGVGGVVVARRLRRLLPSEHRILVVDRRPEVSFAPSYLWVVNGERRPEQITRQLAGLARFGLEFRCAEAVALDPVTRTVEIAGDRIRGDALVLAPGAQLNPAALPGSAGVAHHFYELDAALRLREALQALKGGRVMVAVSSLPYRCPAAPHEALLMMEHDLRTRLGPGKAALTFVTPESQPLPVAGPTVGDLVARLHAERGITARFATPPVRVHSHRSTPAGSPPSTPIPGELELPDGSREAFDLLVTIPAHVAPSFLRASGVLSENGWIAVDRATLAMRFAGIWALGDVTHLPLANGGMLPKAGVFAQAEGETVAREVAAHLLGRGERAGFAGEGGCYLEMGGGAAAFAHGRFFTEPDPTITLEPPDRRWHRGKAQLEQRWLKDWY